MFFMFLFSWESREGTFVGELKEVREPWVGGFGGFGGNRYLCNINNMI